MLPSPELVNTMTSSPSLSEESDSFSELYEGDAESRLRVAEGDLRNSSFEDNGCRLLGVGGKTSGISSDPSCIASR